MASGKSCDWTNASVIDTHTAGEPTRVVLTGGPQFRSTSLAEQREEFRCDFDQFRSAVIHEPRGSEALVGALLCPPEGADSIAGVIFFNNVGVLQMCGHGTMGVAAALAHLDRLAAGPFQLDTPVGPVACELEGEHRVTIQNVPAFRARQSVTLNVPGTGPVRGDIAWGGNWFFIIERPDERICLERAPELTGLASQIREALRADGITAPDGAEIDHVELSGPPQDPRNHARNFVLCPGGAYDRSPCGTGTSAKLACLAASGELAPGELFRQEGILGTVFEGRYACRGDSIIPTIAGEAFVTAEATLHFDPRDPFRFGIRPSY
jgi:4-hydroxyproline epimerase